MLEGSFFWEQLVDTAKESLELMSSRSAVLTVFPKTLGTVVERVDVVIGDVSYVVDVGPVGPVGLEKRNAPIAIPRATTTQNAINLRFLVLGARFDNTFAWLSLASAAMSSGSPIRSRMSRTAASLCADKLERASIM